MTRSARLARLASVITAAIGGATGLWILFGPTGMRCSSGTIGQAAPGEPVRTLAPAYCESTRMVDVQPVWPMPFLALAVWSLAPLLGVVGVWTGRTWLVALALVIEASSIISFGAGPYYLTFVLVPLAVTWVLARRARATLGASPPSL